MDLSRFDSIELLPGAQAYRRILDEATQRSGWAVATAATTVFIEGTPYERGEIDPAAPRRPEPPLDQHPLVLHYGLPVEALALTKAHRKVEGNHRAAAWRIILDHVPAGARSDVIDTLERALAGWLAYRDDVAAAVGLRR
jgi:pyrroloquinoline-quinone synthase